MILFKTHWKKFLIAGVLTIIAFDFLSVVWFSRFLRPSADDYCAGVVAQQGFFGAPLELWKTWSGYFFTMWIENILMGLPLLHLPWSLSSSISFLMAAIGLGIVIFIIYPRNSNNRFRLNTLLIIAPFMWWAYLWVPYAVTRETSPLANGLTHWQTLTSGYIVTTEILLILWVTCWSFFKRHDGNFVSIFLFGLLGLLFGFTSEPINLAAFSVFLLALGWRLLRNRALRLDSRDRAWIFFSLFLLVGFFAAHLSPGNLARTALINPNLEVSLDRLGFLIAWTFPYAIEHWILAYFNWGGVNIFVFVISLYFFIGKIDQGDDCSKLFLCAWKLSGFGLLIYLVARFTEAFSYGAYWHFIPGIVCVFLSILFLGAWAGMSLARYSGSILKLLMIVLLAISLLLGLFGNYKMIKSIYKRGIEWSQGAAPLPGVTDIEEEWVRNCWIKLRNFRPDQNSQSR